MQLRRKRWGVALLEPRDERGTRRIVCGGGVDLLQTNAREGDVIHLRRARDPALMFEMARRALGDIGVKGARLALQDIFVVGVANDAAFRRDALERSMARGAIIFEERVCGR